MTYHGPSLALQVDQQENLHQDLWIVQRELESRSKLQQEKLSLLDCPMCVIISSCLESLESKLAICCLRLFVHYCVWLLKPNAWFVEALFCCMLWQTVFKTSPEVQSNRQKKTKNLQFPSKSRTTHDASQLQSIYSSVVLMHSSEVFQA